MAQTKRMRVYGTRPPCAHNDRTNGPTATRRAPKSLDDFVRYTDSDDEQRDGNAPRPPPNADVMNTSYNFVDYIRSREYGMREYRTLKRYHAAKHMVAHELFKEHIIPLGSISKIFCSQWLGANKIAFATKCNKIMIYNVNSNRLDEIPLIRGHDFDENYHTGIYALKQNPSHSMLATGAYNSNEIAVYRSPSLDPITLATGSHREQIYDIDWLDDEFLVSVSKDNIVALWKIQDHEETDDDSGQPIVKFVNSTVDRKCKAAKKVRSVTYNNSFKEMILLSLNGYIHTWDVNNFRQTLSRKLSSCQENVCMAINNDGDVYAVGSRSYILILDARTLNTIYKIPLKFNRSGVRSLSFQDNMVTVGTGIGYILFYDIKAGKYLESTMKPNKIAMLKISKGYMYPGEEELMPHRVVNRLVHLPAIYTHCYDHSSSRLFCGGGPFVSELFGHYAAIWA